MEGEGFWLLAGAEAQSEMAQGAGGRRWWLG